MWHRRTAVLACAALTVTALAAPGPTTPANASVQPCSSGLVALTFDDGPDAEVTSRLLRILRERHVPATFFVVGERVDAAPRATRRAYHQGFTIANHSYHHEQLTTLGDAAIRRSLRHTRRSIRRSGARPSNLMRPPYGSIDSRVRAVVADLNLVPVLWTVDPRDWEGDSTAAIASRVLAQLRPHRRNIVLQHDGIGNSPNSVQAVPRIVKTARARGYCFAALGPHGRPRPPVPRVRVDNVAVNEGDPGHAGTIRFHLTLDQPTSRDTSVRVHTVAGTADPGVDFVAVDTRVVFPVGVTSRSVSVRTRGDRHDEPTERLRLRLSVPHRMRIADATGLARIRDDDRPPVARVKDAEVVEPETGSAPATVTLRLDRPSGRRVTLWLRTVPGTASRQDYVTSKWTRSFPPGQTTRTIAVPILHDDVDEDEEYLQVKIVEVRHATVGDGTGKVTILDPAPPT